MVFICPPGISALFSSGWITSGSATRQSPAPVQNSYEDRHRHAVPWLHLCFCAGLVHSVQHWPPEVRSYFAYFAYSEVLFVYLSLAGSVSICNRLQAAWNSTSLECDSSVLHTGTPSYCSSWSDRNNTFCHASGISWLSQRFLRQNREQWWNMCMCELVCLLEAANLLLSGGQAGPWCTGSRDHLIKVQTFMSQWCTSMYQYASVLVWYSPETIMYRYILVCTCMYLFQTFHTVVNRDKLPYTVIYCDICHTITY